MLGSPIEPIVPAPFDRPQEAVEHPRVSGDPVILVMPSELLSQLSVLLASWQMAVLTAPPTDPCDRPSEAVRGCLQLDHPVPSPGLRPIMGEAQQIERPPTRGFRRLP